MLIAPITRPGVVLSQPPISTAPSIGWLRSSSSASMARKLRYSMVDGFTNGSASDIAGSSSGKPPACSTPRLTSSARARRWPWQALMSLQVLMMPITGLPAQSGESKPIWRRRERWPNERRSLTPSQRWLRKCLRVAHAVTPPAAMFSSADLTLGNSGEPAVSTHCGATFVRYGEALPAARAPCPSADMALR